MTPLRTFGGFSPVPYPARRDDWEGLAAEASALHEGRVAGYPRQVEQGALGQDEADAGIRRAAAIAELWHRVASAADLPEWQDWPAEFDASWPELHRELHRVATDAARRAATLPGDAAAQRRAEHMAALAWHLHAYGNDPHISVAHGFAQYERRRAAQRRAAA